MAVDRDVVDTEVLSAFSFTRTPDVLSSSNVTGTGATFTGVAMLAVLLSSHDEVNISCESRFLPVENPLYVQAVDNTATQYQLEIERMIVFTINVVIMVMFLLQLSLLPM